MTYAPPLLLMLSVIFIFSPVSSTSSRRAVNVSSKAGLTSPSPDALREFTQTGKVSWYYNWSPRPSYRRLSRYTDTTLEFVPMLWGTRQIEEFQNFINEQTIDDYSIQNILGMNEPQQEGQANLSAEQGVDMWIDHLEPLKALGVRLGSPAPSSAPSGMTWLQDFFRLCDGGCSVDFMPLHYYGVNASHFKEYMTSFHDTFQRPIWVTEWACHNFNQVDEQCSQDDIILFLNSTQSWLEDTPWIERYSYFGAGFPNLQGVNQENQLIDTSGELTDLGLQYIGIKDPETNGTGSADGPPSGGEGVQWEDVAPLNESVQRIVNNLRLTTMAAAFVILSTLVV